MSNFLIREYNMGDIPRLTRIWNQVFGDSEEFISGFFRLLPKMGTGVLAICDNEIAGAAYVLCAQKALSKGEVLPAAYIYAVAVDPRFRRMGIGEALTKAAAREGRRRGAEIISTLPAEPSLYKWYEKIIGTKYLLRRRKEIIPSCIGQIPVSISWADYNKRREELLSSAEHLCLSDAEIEFEGSVCADSRGGFYAVGESIAAAYLSENRAIIQELICPDRERRRNAAALAAALGAEEAVLFSPDIQGEPYIALSSDKLSGDFVWNLAFD